MLPKTAAAAIPTPAADNAMANARRSLTMEVRLARRPSGGPAAALGRPGPNRRLPFGTIPLFR